MKEYHCICGEFFDDNVQQNKHILSHFDQKHCIDCDNQLIFVAGKWYQPHIEFICNPIKTESEHDQLNIDATLLNEHLGDKDAQAPNIVLVDLPTLLSNCSDENFDQHEDIGNIETSSTGQISKDNECELCGKIFSQKSSVKRHQQICPKKYEESEPSLSEKECNRDEHDANTDSSSLGPKSKIPIVCEICGTTFTKKSSLWRHRKICPKNGETSKHPMVGISKNAIKAPAEPKNEPSQYQKTSSKTAKATAKSFICALCSREFSQQSSLDRHSNICKARYTDDLVPDSAEEDNIEMSIESGQEQVLEDDTIKVDCYYIVETPKPSEEPSQSTSVVASDELKKETWRKYACKVCSTRFVYRHGVISHYYQFHDEHFEKDQRLYDIKPTKIKRDAAGNLKCNYCTATLKSSILLGRHKRLFHRERLAYGKLKCPECPKKFPNKMSMESHMWWSHKETMKKTPNKQFTCYLCHNDFQNPKALVVHMRTHPNIEYRCCINECTEQYDSSRKLYTHLLSHSRGTEKKFICDHCGKTFGCMYWLRIHMNMHTGEKPYTCDVCNKSFAKPSGLYRHRIIHFGTTRYTCDVANCNRAFNQPIDLHRHRFKAHGIFRKKFPCTLCDQVFPENSLLRKHMANHENV